MSSAARTVPGHPDYEIATNPFRNYETVKTYLATDINGNRLLYTETTDQDVLEQVRLLDQRELDFIPKLVSLSFDDGYFVHIAPPGESIHHTVTRMIKKEVIFPQQLLWHYMKELARIQYELDGESSEENIIYAMSPDDVFIDFDKKIYLINFVKMCSQTYMKSDGSHENVCSVRRFKGREHREISTFDELQFGEDFSLRTGNAIYSMGVCMYLLANLHWPWPVRGDRCKDSYDCLAWRNEVYRSNYSGKDPKASISAASINFVIDHILNKTKDLTKTANKDVIGTHDVKSLLTAEETGCKVKDVVFNRGQLMYQINRLKPCQLRPDDTMVDLCKKFQNPAL